jgi:glucose/mannose transport system substrate-binding protein
MKGCLVGQGGADYYRSFVSGQNACFAGKSTTADDVFRAAVADFGTMVTYANTADIRTLTWDQAVGRVVQGQAAMTIMGDWALGEFMHQGMKPDIDFGEVPAPGSQGTFIFTTDTFVLPKGAKNRDGAISLLSEFGSLGGQAAFNPLKGSIAPRTDADPAVYNAISKKTLQDFHTLPLVGDFALTVPQPFVDAFDAALDQFATDGLAQNVVIATKNNYDTLVKGP